MPLVPSALLSACQSATWTISPGSRPCAVTHSIKRKKNWIQWFCAGMTA